MAYNQLCDLDEEGNGTYKAEGITKLFEGLKGSAVSSLECAASPYRMLAFVSMPSDTPPALGSLSDNQFCGHNGLWHNDMFYNAGCITKLCEALKGSAMTSLKCAASAESSLFCQCALSLCPTHIPFAQYRAQLHQRRGRLRARCRPQGDADYHPKVGRHPIHIVLDFLSAPVDHLLSHRSHPAPSLAVSGATTSEPRAPPCSPPSSRRRRSPNWGKPPPQSVRFSVSAR